MNKKYKCSVCEWEGKGTHVHHIIPIGCHGEDNDNNRIELCPNCHSEAHEDLKNFNIKHNLIGESISEEKMKDLNEAGMIHTELINEGFYDLIQNHINLLKKYIRLLEIEKKYNIDKFDYIAFIMGITRNSVLYYEKYP